MKVNLDVQVHHQMRQIERKSARAHARKLERIRRDLAEMQRVKRLDTTAEETSHGQV